MSADELVKEFLIESFENLSTINDQLTKLENNPKDKELVNAIYRVVHTMKGSAGFLGFKKLNDLTHNAETLLDYVREDQIKISSGLIDVLFGVFDICQDFLKKIENTGNEGDRDVSKLNDKLTKFMEKEKNKAFSDNNDESVELSDYHHTKDDSKSIIDDYSISSAALDSLREQVEAGLLDSSVLDEFLLEAEREEDSTENKSVTIDEENEVDFISSAALDSLREQVEAGVIDKSILEEFERDLKGQDSSSLASNSSARSTPNLEEDTENIVKVIQDNASIQTSKEVEVENIDEEDYSLKVNKSVADSFVRVNVEVLDKIMNIVGELVLNRNQIVQHSNNLNNGELTRLSQQLNVITSELQGEVMSTRMQPIGNVLNIFERLIRDLSREFNKKIQLKLSGQETELDKTLIEAIKDPLVHIVRNACDHGLEPSDQRLNFKKNPTGMIEIKAYNESGQVIIEIIDDGKGLCKDKILAKAIEKGLVTPDKIKTLTDQQVFHLIFNPGFSTAEKVTNISGRGFGLDVVKTNIEKIGGSVNVISKMGEGTSFKLKIPLTLAIVPALIIKSKNECFAIPQTNLLELVRIDEDEMERIQKIKGTEFLKLRGNLTPIFRLNNLLNLEDVQNKSLNLKNVALRFGTGSGSGSVTTSKEHLSLGGLSDRGLNVVILSADNRIFGIVVDEIMDTEEIVVKPLINQLNNIGVFGGATIMGDGRVALIVDALGFLSHFTGTKDKKVQEVISSKEEVNQDAELQENLLFRLQDDRIYAVPLGLVSRLEEFDLQKVEKTGNQPIMRYLNAPMPLIDVEKTIKLTVKSVLESKNSDKLPCIVTNVRRQNYGIVVKEILDINIERNKIDSNAVDREGIMGTIFVGNQTVSMLDLYQIITSQGLGAAKKTVVAKKNKTVLLVDDSVMYRKLEGDALIDEGYDVIFAINGRDALTKLHQNKLKIDLIVTDIEMPEVNGFDFAKQVREDQQFNDLQIIALSTRVSDADKIKGIDCGFNFHLEKFKRDEMIELVTKIIN